MNYNNNEKNELFRKAVQSSRNYLIALEKGIPEFQDYFDALHEEQIALIKKNGWFGEYEEFSTILTFESPSEDEIKNSA